MSDFWRGKRVLVTGHTGFKGAWLSLWLGQMGAQVSGLALEPESPFFDQLGLAREMDHRIGDIRDAGLVARVMRQVDPEVVIHMAAQSLVLTSYDSPVETWATNVMGSLHVMEAMRALEGPRVGVMVTTDKVYANAETGRAFAENDALGGHDPYSASKAAMEIGVDSWRKSFLRDKGLRVSSVRAGNVIGGGDWAENRIVPDMARALGEGRVIEVRNPDAVRPWQHVLVPLEGYLRLVEAMAGSEEATYQSAFNFGPEEEGVRSVRDLVETALKVWPGEWTQPDTSGARHEATLLTLDPTKARYVLGHRPRWGFEASVGATMAWYRDVAQGADPREVTLRQIAEFEAS